jgi:hypothetical protein
MRGVVSMHKRHLAGAAALAAMLVAAVALGGPRRNLEELPCFDGKTLVVFCLGEPRVPNCILVRARLTTIGGRVFLTGVGADTMRPGDFRQNAEINVAWDAVTNYYVLAYEQYLDYLATAKLP